MGRATHLTSEDLASLGDRLRAEYRRLLAAHSRSLPRREGETPPDLGDEAELAEESRGVDVSLSQADVDHRRFAQVQRALRKLDEGTYGLSDVTGEPISRERLDALPWATSNVDDLDQRDAAPSHLPEH